MRCVHDGFEFEIDDQWWSRAGMTGFRTERDAYLVDRHAFPGFEIVHVEVSRVAPVRRTLSHGVFNDGELKTAEERVSDIFAGFLANQPIPPVEVVRLKECGAHHFRLRHGVHRFYCSVAAGFRCVPSIEVEDFQFETPTREA
jgi:hypothetical protein